MAVPGNREKFSSGKQFPSDIPHHKPEKTHESAAGVPLDPKPRTALRPSGTCFLVVGFDDGRAVSGPLHRSAPLLGCRERVVCLAHRHDLAVPGLQSEMQPRAPDGQAGGAYHAIRPVPRARGSGIG